MTQPIDMTVDWLADASLTPEQRRIWNHARHELKDAAARIKALEDRIANLEHGADEPLTVLTRPEFNREVARMLAFDQRYGGVSSVLYFDFENLDDVVNRHGKAIANAAIREISTCLTRHVRGSDIVGRLAPDEFGVLLVRCDNAGAWRKGEHLGAALQEALAEIHGCRLDLKISFGAYTFEDDRDIASGLKEAAQAMTKTERL